MSDRLLNRELAWLSFNEGVLEEARDPSVPLLERLRFLAIFSSNLDEFFMVRYAGLWRQIDAGVAEAAATRKVLDAVSATAHDLVRAQHRVLLHEILPELAQRGVKLRRTTDFDPEQRAFLADRYRRHMLPVITPIAIDSGHPFPYVANRALCLVAELEAAEPADLPPAELVVLHIPVGVLPRFLALPSPDGEFHVALLEDVVRLHLPALFGGSVVKSCHAVRVTRDAELDVDEDKADDLLLTIEAAVRNRRLGAAVRLQYERGIPNSVLTRLRNELELDAADVFEAEGFTAFADLFQLYALIDRPELKFAPWHPQPIPQFEMADDVFSAIDAGDILVHHPYQSFDPVVRLIESAAADRDVLAIKMTLYRLGGESRIAQALLNAALAGKEVAVLVELRARFNEASNIAWARKLEAAGAHVVYGIVGYKTHVKAALVVRRGAVGLRRYCHLGTGNYNEANAMLYGDFGLFTAGEPFGDDLTHLFNLLTGYARPPTFQRLLVAPMSLRDALAFRIQRECERARSGRPARLIIKLNSLVDPVLCEELYEASAAGVRVDIIVRGICCLRPGVPGLSDNVRAIRILDRFLEHARVFWFENGGQHETWLSSADWMQRNLDGRLEAAFPVDDAALAQEIQTVLAIQLTDTVKARELNGDGTTRRIREPDGGVRSQLDLMERAKIASARATQPPAEVSIMSKQ